MKPRVIIIHSLDHARSAIDAAIQCGLPVTIASAPFAAAYVGASWFRKVVEKAVAEQAGLAPGQVTAVLDCGDEPGLALGALRQGTRIIRYSGSAASRGKITAIATELGAEVWHGKMDSLDLGEINNAMDSCRKWLKELNVEEKGP
jgi:hypothetical protein